MKNLIYTTVLLAFLSSCGGESENYANAKIHRCNMLKYAEEVKQGMDSMNKLKEATSFYEEARESCINEDGMKDFDEKIKGETCE